MPCVPLQSDAMHPTCTHFACRFLALCREATQVPCTNGFPGIRKALWQHTHDRGPSVCWMSIWRRSAFPAADQGAASYRQVCPVCRAHRGVLKVHGAHRTKTQTAIVQNQVFMEVTTRRFERIEQRLDKVESDIQGIRDDLGPLKAAHARNAAVREADLMASMGSMPAVRRRRRGVASFQRRLALAAVHRYAGLPGGQSGGSPGAVASVGPRIARRRMTGLAPCVWTTPPVSERWVGRSLRAHVDRRPVHRAQVETVGHLGIGGEGGSAGEWIGQPSL